MKYFHKLTWYEKLGFIFLHIPLMAIMTVVTLPVLIILWLANVAEKAENGK